MSSTSKQLEFFFRSVRELLKQGMFHRSTLIVSFLLVLLLLLLPIWRILPLAKDQPYIPLHYNIYFGIDRFGPWQQTFVIPAIGFLFLIVSLIMQTHFFRNEKMLAIFFAISSIFLECTLLVAMVLLILLNI